MSFFKICFVDLESSIAGHFHEKRYFILRNFVVMEPSAALAKGSINSILPYS